MAGRSATNEPPHGEAHNREHTAKFSNADGSATPTGKNTKQGTRKKTARASDDQSRALGTKPLPEKGEAQGRNPAGHCESGNETQQPPADETARTHATERNASEAANERAG